MQFTAKCGNSRLRLKQILGSDPAEAAEHLRANEVELPKQKWLAVRALKRFRRAVARRAALQNVQDVNVLAAQPALRNNLV